MTQENKSPLDSTKSSGANIYSRCSNSYFHVNNTHIIGFSH